MYKTNEVLYLQFNLIVTGQNASQYSQRSSPDTSSSFDFFPSTILPNNNLLPESSIHHHPNKSDSGVEGATSSLDAPLSLMTTSPEDGPTSFSNPNNNEIYSNSQATTANNLPNTITTPSSPTKHTPYNQSKFKYSNNSGANRGNINRRGSFSRRWKGGPGYASDYQPSSKEYNSNNAIQGDQKLNHKHSAKVNKLLLHIVNRK